MQTVPWTKPCKTEGSGLQRSGRMKNLYTEPRASTLSVHITLTRKTGPRRGTHSTQGTPFPTTQPSRIPQWMVALEAAPPGQHDACHPVTVRAENDLDRTQTDCSQTSDWKTGASVGTSLPGGTCAPHCSSNSTPPWIGF